MAVETQAPAEKVVVTEAAPEEKAVPPPSAPQPEEDPKKALVEATAVTEPDAAEEKAKPGEKAAVAPSSSFKEESNLVSDLPAHEKKALHELKELVRAALANNDFSPTPAKDEQPAPAETTPPAGESSPAPEVEEKPAGEDDGVKTVEAIAETVVSSAPDEQSAPASAPAPEVLIWGVPLLADERSDTILLKFLRARDFNVADAMAMLKSAVLWRAEFGVERLLDEDLGAAELERAMFMRGLDRDAHPVSYNVYGEFEDKELYALAFGDEEKRERFLRFMVQYLEKGIRRMLDFGPGGVSTMVQVTDLRNSPGPAKRELRQVTDRALALLQDNYPEFVAKQIFINVPWWYLAFYRMVSPFLTQRSKSKLIFAGPSKSTETLFKYIAPEQVPVQYGGLSKENDPDFNTSDAVTEITIKPSGKEVIEIPVYEACLLVWEIRVLGWEVSYGAEFVPSAEGGYTVIVQKKKKMVLADDPILKNSFKIGEPGKIVLTIDNNSSKKKKLLYRSKAKSSVESSPICC